MSSHDASGESVSYELGRAAHDTIELRDGSVLFGALVSINGIRVQVRIGGNAQDFDQNQVKRILFNRTRSGIELSMKISSTKLAIDTPSRPSCFEPFSAVIKCGEAR